VVLLLVMQKELASVAESVADRLRASEESRNQLIEQTRDFKKNISEVSRRHFDLLWCYKIIFGLVHVDHDAFFELFISSNRGRQYKFSKHCTNPARSNFFSACVLNVWNAMSINEVDFGSVAEVKCSLKRQF